MNDILFTPLRISELETLVKNSVREAMTEATPQPTETNKLLTLPETAKLLTLSKASIYRLVRERKIPYHKSGGRLYFFEQEVRDWVKNGRE